MIILCFEGNCVCLENDVGSKFIDNLTNIDNICCEGMYAVSNLRRERDTDVYDLVLSPTSQGDQIPLTKQQSD